MFVAKISHSNCKDGPLFLPKTRGGGRIYECFEGGEIAPPPHPFCFNKNKIAPAAGSCIEGGRVRRWSLIENVYVYILLEGPTQASGILNS